MPRALDPAVPTLLAVSAAALACTALADNGAWWVPGILTTRPGAFPELDLRLPIACP